MKLLTLHVHFLVHSELSYDSIWELILIHLYGIQDDNEAAWMSLLDWCYRCLEKDGMLDFSSISKHCSDSTDEKNEAATMTKPVVAATTAAVNMEYCPHVH